MSVLAVKPHIVELDTFKSGDAVMISDCRADIRSQRQIIAIF